MIKKFVLLAFISSFFMALNCEVEINATIDTSPADSAVELALKNLEFKGNVEIKEEDIDVLIDEEIVWKDKLDVLYKYVKIRSLENWEKYQDRYISGAIGAGSVVAIVALVLLYRKCFGSTPATS